MTKLDQLRALPWVQGAWVWEDYDTGPAQSLQGEPFPIIQGLDANITVILKPGYEFKPSGDRLISCGAQSVDEALEMCAEDRIQFVGEKHDEI